MARNGGRNGRRHGGALALRIIEIGLIGRFGVVPANRLAKPRVLTALLNCSLKIKTGTVG